MKLASRSLEASLESKRAGLLFGLAGLSMGFLAWERASRRHAHTVGRQVAAQGRIPDLRLYAYGSVVASPFRTTLGAASAPDLRPRLAP